MEEVSITGCWEGWDTTDPLSQRIRQMWAELCWRIQVTFTINTIQVGTVFVCVVSVLKHCLVDSEN